MPRVLGVFISFRGVCVTFGGTGGCGDPDESDDSDDSDDSGAFRSLNFRFRAMADGRAGVLDGIWKAASITLEVVEVGVRIDGLCRATEVVGFVSVLDEVGMAGRIWGVYIR